eukprot:TRINITY_DN2534_c0_g5_i1.p1 TRINITY_DN2534_c0_g5~~TRINITY_DN2534_c0_g5_i1.p1  ORF type:complete len:434 (-),score=71.99 TRINITY_DN2534_c0_g5_i1:159-1460(-)
MGCSASRKFATSVTSTDIQAFDDKSIRSSLSSTSSDVPGPSKETFGSHGSASSSTEECQRQASRSRRLTASREEDTSLRRLGQPEETQPNLLDREGRPSGKKSRAGEREDSTDPMLSKESDRPKKKVTLNVEVDPTEFWELRSPDARDHVLSPASQKLGTSSSPSPPSSHRITLAPLDQPPVLDTVNLREPISPKLARNSFRMKRSNSGFVAVEEPLHMHRRHSGDLKTLPPKLRNLAKMDKAFGESSEDDLKAFLDRDGPSLYQDSMEADASRGLKRFALAPPPPASSAPAAAGGGGGGGGGVTLPPATVSTVTAQAQQPQQQQQAPLQAAQPRLATRNSRRMSTPDSTRHAAVSVPISPPPPEEVRRPMTESWSAPKVRLDVFGRPLASFDKTQRSTMVQRTLSPRLRDAGPRRNSFQQDTLQRSKTTPMW